MSWSVEAIGTKAAVRASVDAQLTKSASYYAGKEEEKDVLAAKDRILSALDGLAMEPSANGVRVSANGSRSDGWSAGLSITVQRVFLCVEVPAAAPPAPEPSPAPAAPEPAPAT